MTKKLFAAVLAVAVGAAWTVFPACAADTTAGQKTDNAIDKTKEKAADVKDTVHDKASEVKDKVQSKTSGNDKTSDTNDGVVGKTKAKAVELKDKVMAKTVDRASEADVRSAQQSLKEKGFDPGPVDGKLGPRTIAALRDFQKKEGLKVNGRLDSETKARLSAAASTTTTTPSASPSTTAPSKTQRVRSSPAASGRAKASRRARRLFGTDARRTGEAGTIPGLSF